MIENPNGEFYAQTYHPGKASDPVMKLSVLLCTYQRHFLLEKALRALIETSIEKPDEIVIVNGGDECADGVVQRFIERAPMPVKLIKTRNVNLATSRNIGIPHCSGEILAMTDDDAMVFPDWVTAMKRAHREHPEAGAVGGVVLGMNTDSLIGKVADIVTFPSWSRATYVRTLPGVNISYKRDAVNRLGPQDPNLPRGEDVDYNWRVQQLGYEIFFDPRIRVHHYHRPSFRALLEQFYMYGRSYYLVRRKWPEMYSLYPRGGHSMKNLVKLLNFPAEAFYGPFLRIRRIPGWSLRLRALPLLFLTGIAWRAGILVELFRRARSARWERRKMTSTGA